MSTVRYFAACSKGLEYLLVDELKALGAVEAREQLSGVRFEGDAQLGYRACLWSRLASRILLPISDFQAADEGALYDGVAEVDWSRHLEATGSLAIDAHGRTAGITHAQFAAQRVKDAIVDQCRDRFGTRPDVERERPDVRINLLLRGDRAHLAIDLSGTALFLRGYRRGQGDAPLKENLAAAMLLRARWPEIYAQGGPLVDPMCGSGTLLIEGAWLAADVAPGLQRDYFGFLGWRGFDPAAWEAIRREAQARADAGLKALRPVFFGSDADARVLNAARHNAQAAGVAGFIKLTPGSLSSLAAPPHDAPGLVIANPPYGERMGEVETLAPTYREFGDALKRAFVGWRAALITSHADLGHAIGLRAERKYQLYNGALECVLLCFDEIRAPGAVTRELKPLSAGAEAMANRLRKNLKHLKSWRAREGVFAYRAYDADLPDYAAAIDVYETESGDVWAHVQEYAPPAEVPEDIARRRLSELVRVTGEVLGVARDRIVTKTRRPQSRHEKYQRVDERQHELTVIEGGLKFLVNLHDYLDTGLFLDHRPMRLRLRELARGKRFLNLFAYTGAASVHAAAGGASSTTSVDLSATYLEWAGRNLALNGFVGRKHDLVQADVMAWLAAETGTFDLIFVDPPTFSNSKRADDFDVQKEHVRLLHLCMARLAPEGLLVFSNNFRRFKLDEGALAAFEIREITRQTIGPDFARDQRIHHCFELRHRS